MAPEDYQKLNTTLIQTLRKKIAELKNSEEQFKSIFNKANDGIAVADSQTKKLVLVNFAFCKLLGYSADELQSMGVADIHPKKDLPYVIEQFEKQLQGKIKIASGLPVLRKNGEVIYCDINSSPINLKGKQFLMGFFRDVTERKKAEEAISESEEKFRNIFDNASDGILPVDPITTKFILANKTICKMLGYSEDELKKLSIRDITPKKDLHHALIAFKKHKQKKMGMSLNMPLQRKDCSIFYADIHSTPVKFGGKTYLAGIFRDVTERKNAEEKIKESEEK